MYKPVEILNTEEEYKNTINKTIEIFHAEEGTPKSSELDILLLLVKDYEDKHFTLPDPIY